MSKTKHISLTDNDKTQIIAINKTITTVPRQLVQATQELLFSTLQNGNPLNRLLRDPETNHIIGFLAVEDTTDDKGNKIAYLGATAFFPRPQRHIKINLDEEIQKLIKRAKKCGYKRLECDGFNPILNRFLKKYGFVEQKQGAGAPSFLVLDLEEATPETKEITQWMKYLHKQAPELMQQLTNLQITHLRNALTQAQHHHQDPQLAFLYGALDTLQQHQQISFLDTPFSLKKLYEHSKSLDAQNTKVEKAQEYANFLAQTLHLDNRIYIFNIQELLTNNSPKKRDKLLKEYFISHHITYDPTIVYNDTYLSTLNPNQEPQFITDVEIEGKTYQLVSLITKAQMEKESKQLGHCVGTSDFYIEKVKDKKLLVLSLRDEQKNPQYTIEYNIKAQSIKQFKGKDNKLPTNNTLITATLDAITKAGYPITSYTEDLDHQTLFSQNGHHQITPTITLEQILSLYRSGNALVLTGKYSVPPTITAEKLTSLCKIPQLSLETTHIPSTLKRNIKQIKGNLKENAEEFLYDQLTSVGGSLDAHNASEISAPILISVGGSLDAHNASEFSAPALISVGGSLDVTNASEFSAPALTSVDGDLDVGNASEFSAPALTSVGKYLYAQNANEFSAPALISVGGSLIARNASEFSAPALISVGGSLDVGNASEFSAPALTSVDGSLIAQNASEFSAPALTSVDGDLYVTNASEFSAPALTSVGEDLNAQNASEFSAPALTSVGEDLNAQNASEFSAPALISVDRNLIARNASEFSAPVLKEIQILYLSSRLQKFIINPKCEIQTIYYQNTPNNTTKKYSSLSSFLEAYPQYRQ